MTSHEPETSRATFAISGATMRHGPHHGAQKSTSTGKEDFVIVASKLCSSVTSIGSTGGGSSL
jgi:hypothetical protein